MGKRIDPVEVIKMELSALCRDRGNLNDELKEVYFLIAKYTKALEILELEEE
jgi:hypothetical protein